jgi:hypothetical protein
MLDQAPKCTPYRAVHMARQLVAKCSVGGKIAVGSLHSVVVKANTLGAHAHVGGKKCRQGQSIQRATWRVQPAGVQPAGVFRGCKPAKMQPSATAAPHMPL